MKLSIDTKLELLTEVVPTEKDMKQIFMTQFAQNNQDAIITLNHIFDEFKRSKDATISEIPTLEPIFEE